MRLEAIIFDVDGTLAESEEGAPLRIQSRLRAALAAGVATLVIRSEYTRRQSFPGAALVVDDPEEAAPRLGAGSTLEALRRLHAAAPPAV